MDAFPRTTEIRVNKFLHSYEMTIKPNEKGHEPQPYIFLLNTGRFYNVYKMMGDMEKTFRKSRALNSRNQFRYN